MRWKIYGVAAFLYFYHPAWFVAISVFALWYDWQWHKTEAAKLHGSHCAIPGCNGWHRAHL